MTPCRRGGSNRSTTRTGLVGPRSSAGKPLSSPTDAPIQLGFPAVRAGARGGVVGVLGMTSKDRIEHMVTAGRFAEHDERVRLRRAGKAATGARWHAVLLAREHAHRASGPSLRELRDRPCGARTRAGHPCRRKGMGKGGRCPNHGGMSTGPRTQEGRARVSTALKARWVLGGPLPLKLCGEAAKQPMLDPREIRKRIAYAERRIRNVKPRPTPSTTPSQARSTPWTSASPPALRSANEKWVALQAVGAA